MAGKSYTTNLIVSQIMKQLKCSVTVISQEWFYKNISSPNCASTTNWESPDAIDFERIVRVLTEIKSKAYVWINKIGRRGLDKGKGLITSTPLIIFEGTYAFYDPRVAALMKYKMFIDCDMDVMLVRRMRCAVDSFDFSIDSALTHYCTFVRTAFEHWIKQQRNYADIIINSDSTTSYVVAYLFCSVYRTMSTSFQPPDDY